MSTRDFDHEHDDEEELLDEDAHDDDMFARRERSKHSSRVVGEFLRRTIDSTLGQVQSSGALPKEAISYLLHQGDKGRKEIVRIVANEVGDFLRHTDLSSEIVKVLTNVQVDMSASIRFKRNPDGRLATEVDEGSSVSLHGAHDEPEASKEDED